ncbi:MAG TPA: SUMF1/EgtB/PvdO family nonheme iron enzyme [Candidatus Paceibacterota bacterium]|nr:SUMF1/EgtB/PvdO family nonheme iron enzyme [Candidatus Paceibacterota bacterium]HPT40157.1 SUMF1/EgtB/PvdO family nonheme iron enzyme [Candidatus Paceibacterota bacterium]
MFRFFKQLRANKDGFTLIELLIVIAILALLMSIIVITLNPAEILKKTRDSKRISDLATLEKALSIFLTTKKTAVLGTYQIVYVSLPATNSNCSDLILPALPTGYTYQCSTMDNYRKTNGTGWIPVNFESLDVGSPMSSLPIDPNNNFSASGSVRNNFFYTYTISSDTQRFELNTKLESSYYGFKDRDGYALKDAAQDDTPLQDGGDSGLYEKGMDLTLMPDSGGLCPTGMVWVPQPGRFCIDKYEATYSASGTKPDGTTCSSNCPVSTYNTNPWSTRLAYPSASQTAAITYCQNMGKVLPTDFEWWVAAIGTPDPYNSKPSRISGSEGPEPCMIWNTSSADGIVERPQGSSQTSDGYTWSSDTNPLIKTGTASNCKSTVGAYDMVGNLWEWTNNTLTCNGSTCSYSGTTLPAQNYITSINNEGTPITSGSVSTAYNYDYLYENVAANTYGFLRSGGWYYGATAGRFGLNVTGVPGDAGSGVGFRCVFR